MVVVQASKLPLPPPPPPYTTSFLFEPNSLSLALMHSDSSLSLYSPLPFPALSSLPSTTKPQNLIPPPCSSSSFLLLRQHQNPSPRVVFLVAGPYMGGAQVVIRLYLLQKSNLYTKVQVLCNQKGLEFDPKVGGVLADVNHGVSVKIVGGTNFFVMHSVSSRKVWIFAVKLVGDGDLVKVMRCGVIECCVPVWSISVSFGFLILGEDNGVRVFNLRQLVKGKTKKVKSSSLNGNLEGKGARLPNGAIHGDNTCYSSSGTACNAFADGKIEKHCVSVKQRSVRCKEDSGEGGSFFVAFKEKVVEGLKSMTAKAVSIQALSAKRFMILDSGGDIHILSLSNPVGGANITSHMRRLPHSMKVQKLAVLADTSSGTQTVWLSDLCHTVHVMTLSDEDVAGNNNDGDESQESSLKVSVTLAIFPGESIQDIVPLAANGFLSLGEGNVYAYAIS